MSNPIIQVHKLSKQYRLGEVGTGSLQQDLNRWWHKVRGKEDPYLRIGEENDRTARGNTDFVWALRDISFEVEQGDVVGIIGRNGAGKSTLLKILSRITEPTSGSISMRGRVASLLEVGTGMHPELTGRENIYLNGAILGMTKKEINRKFDEIVDFAGVERYIDTPVKRYSTGMHVRLGFAVAAHLEPEILIVDEVLAVGDAEFQKKCLGKMREVSEADGRTILFVSHNMMAIKNLCYRAIVLNNGGLIFDGTPDVGIEKYFLTEEHLLHQVWKEESQPHDILQLCEVKLDFNAAHEVPLTTEVLTVVCRFRLKQKVDMRVVLILRTSTGDVVFEVPSATYNLHCSTYDIGFTIPANFLNAIAYAVQLNFVSAEGNVMFYLENVLRFKPEESRHLGAFYHLVQGVIKPNLQATLKEVKPVPLYNEEM